MKLFCYSVLIFFLDFSLGWVTYEDYHRMFMAQQTASEPLQISRNRLSEPGISIKKCQAYKDLVAEYSTSGGLSLIYTQSRTTKEYKCNKFTGLIVGGNKTMAKEFPHMAAIGWKTLDGSLAFKCGGSLISERFVLTVAHCGTDYNASPSVVRLGDQNLALDNDGAQPVEYNVKRFIKHERYHYGTKENDIALIELDRNVTFNEFIRPACLHTENKFQGAVIATGWGKTKFMSDTSDELMKVKLNTVDSATCANSLKDDIDIDRIFDTQICAGGKRNQDTCDGDSGGPIQVSHDDAPCVYNIIAMTSYGVYKCGSILPSIYTRVAPYLAWIEDKVWPNVS